MGNRIPNEVAAELDKRLETLTQEEIDELRREGGRIQVDRSEAARERRREYIRNYRARLALAYRLGVLEEK